MTKAEFKKRKEEAENDNLKAFSTDLSESAEFYFSDPKTTWKERVNAVDSFKSVDNNTNWSVIIADRRTEEYVSVIRDNLTIVKAKQIAEAARNRIHKGMQLSNGKTLHENFINSRFVIIVDTEAKNAIPRTVNFNSVLKHAPLKRIRIKSKN